jgi:hypothetical protein
VQARHAHGVLDGLGAAVGEEDVREALGRPVDDEASRLGAHVVGVLGRHRAQPRGLLLDRGDDAWVLVADVGVDELRREVEVAPAVVVPDVRAAAACYHHRRQLRLRGPRVEDMGTVEAVDAPALVGVGR